MLSCGIHPEPVSGHCHTQNADTHAAGCTLTKVLDELSNAEEFTGIRNCRNVANQLVKEENERWTLDAALKASKTPRFSQAKNNPGINAVTSASIV